MLMLIYLYEYRLCESIITHYNRFFKKDNVLFVYLHLMSFRLWYRYEKIRFHFLVDSFDFYLSQSSVMF